MRKYIDIVEGVTSVEDLAAQCPTYDRFIDKLDGLFVDVLYRGHHGDGGVHDLFMTDYGGHARQYGDEIDAYQTNFSTDVMYFKDDVFDQMRRELRRLSREEFAAHYEKVARTNRHAVNLMWKKAYRVIMSDKPYTENIVPDIETNDSLIPLMQNYATQHGYNIISFLGNDYSDYGGQNEFVVADASKLTDLKKLYHSIQAKYAMRIRELNEGQAPDVTKEWTDTLWVMFNNGPTYDGDLPSKTERDELVDADLADRGEGYNWLTTAGVELAIELGMDKKKEISEGEVVDLAQHKQQKPYREYANAMRDIMAAKREFYKSGNKFMEFARTYVESGFKEEFRPEFYLDVTFRDYRLRGEASALMKEMRKSRRWEIRRTKYHKDFDGEKRGPLARMEHLAMDEARKIWGDRNSSPYGLYVTSKFGFGQSTKDEFNEAGVCHTLFVYGHDSRRPDKYGNAEHDVCHAIDNDTDWQEAMDMMAFINRARIAANNTSGLMERAEMSSVLYHGTSTSKAATAILKSGLRAQSDEKMGRKPRGALTPVQGHVYLTPSVHYAAIYALGGNYVGHDPMKSLKNTGRNRYGYIFVIDSKDINVVQPDEDEVGGACRDAPGIIKYWRENNEAPHTRHMDNLAFGQALCDDVSFCRQLDSFAKYHLTPLQYDKLVNGFYYDIMAVAGKKLLKVMPQHMKDKLVSMGCHVSTPETVMPKEVWKVDKQKSAELGFRAEHLFDIAEKIFPK